MWAKPRRAASVVVLSVLCFVRSLLARWLELAPLVRGGCAPFLATGPWAEDDVEIWP
ncbi:MAG: hypothetical protein JKY34_15450 [Kordiimonadaceae bacterium]|nr:hypothetical protein [Kordiimonadaceae bacterium]